MTVKEGSGETPYPFKLAKLSPMISSKYYEHLINDKSNTSLLEAWDLMMGVHDLTSCIVTLQKALDRKNGVPEPNEDHKKFYMEVD